MDVLRFLMATLVVLLHTIPMDQYTTFVSYGFLHMPQRIAVPMFFLISSYYFWTAYSYNETVKNFSKRIFRWIGIYLVWSFIHMQFYSFEWWYPTYGVLWFFYALIVGNIFVYIIIKNISNLKILTFITVVWWIICSALDAWYGVASNIPILSDIMQWYFNNFMSTLSPFTYGILYGLLGYIMVYSLKLKLYTDKIGLGMLILFIILFAIEGWYVHTLGIVKTYGQYIFTVPLVISILAIVCRYGNKFEWDNSIVLGKMSALIYYIHIMFVYFFSSRYIYTYPDNLKLGYIHEFFYVFIMTTWVAYVIYCISLRIKFLKVLY